MVFFVIMGFVGLVFAAVMAGLFGLLAVALTPAPWPAFAWFPVPVLLAPVLVLGSFLLGLWYLWRVIAGFFRALEEKPW